MESILTGRHDSMEATAYFGHVLWHQHAERVQVHLKAPERRDHKVLSWQGLQPGDKHLRVLQQ